MSRCGSCPIYGQVKYGNCCDGDHGVEECADKLHSLYYDMNEAISASATPPMDPIEKAIADWHSELTGIAIKLGRAELLAQLAEEAAELSQAALKLRRVLDGRNPTPVTEAEATLHLQEELTDVLLCAVTVGVDRTEVERFIRAKSARWSARVEGGGDDA